MTEQPWIVAEQYDTIILDDEELRNVQLIVGPFESEEEAVRYRDWAVENSTENLQAIAVGQLTKIPEGFPED